MLEIKRQSPTGYALFCDDIRLEASGKLTLIGLYGGGELIIFSATLPVVLPHFSILSHVLVDRTELDRPIGIQAFMPWDEKDKPSIKLEQPAGASIPYRPSEDINNDDQLMVGIFTQINLNSFEIKSVGRVRVYAVRGDEYTRLGSLFIKLSPPIQQPQT